MPLLHVLRAFFLHELWVFFLVVRVKMLGAVMIIVTRTGMSVLPDEIWMVLRLVIISGFYQGNTVISWDKIFTAVEKS